MSFLDGRRTTDLDVMIPPAGGWVATGHLESGPAPVAGPATLVLGDLSLTGAIQPSRGGEDSPDHPAFVVAGGAGWRTLLSAGAFASPSAVRLSTVLRVLGQASGEAYDAPPEARLVPGYGWDAGTPADAVLADLVARGAVPTWRVLPSGRTSFTPWPAAGAADAKGTIADRRLARGVREVALTSSVRAFLPGATLEGRTIERVRFVETGTELRVLVWGSTDLGPLDRWRRICLKVFPWLARFGLDPATGNLFVRAADTRIDLAGGGPAVARMGDGTGYLYAQLSAGAVVALWWSATAPPNAAWVPIVSGAIPPTNLTAGTPTSISAGSAKVTCG